MSLFNLLIPRWAIFAAIAALFAGLYAWHASAIHRIEQAAIEKGRTEVYQKWGASNVLRTELAAKEDRANRAEEERRVAAQQEAVNDANTKIQKATADAGAARDTAARLRARVDALIASGRESRCDPAAAAAGPSTDDAIGVLADVLSRADARAGLLADFADRTHIAGQACERSYNSLTGVR